MNKVIILDEFDDGKGINYELTVDLPDDLKTLLSAASVTIQTSAQYSSKTLTDTEKISEVKAHAVTKSKDYIALVRDKMKLHGTTLEV